MIAHVALIISWCHPVIVICIPIEQLSATAEEEVEVNHYSLVTPTRPLSCKKNLRINGNIARASAAINFPGHIATYARASSLPYVLLNCLDATDDVKHVKSTTR